MGAGARQKGIWQERNCCKDLSEKYKAQSYIRHAHDESLDPKINQSAWQYDSLLGLGSEEPVRDKRVSSAGKRKERWERCSVWGGGMACCQLLGLAQSHLHRQAANAASQTGGEFVCKTAALVLTKRGTLHICLLASSSVSGRILLVTLDSGFFPSLL